MSVLPAFTPGERPGADPGPGGDAGGLQILIDEAAYFHVLSLPDRGGAGAAIRAGSRVIGVHVREVLHRFDVVTEAPTTGTPVRARNTLGEPLGRFRQRWVVAPDDFVAVPDRAPPPTPLDPARPQRFVMLDGWCAFGGGGDGFRGFGAGQTLPAGGAGRGPVLAAAVGTILEGRGRFAGHDEGTYVYAGTLAPNCGFTGSLMLRVRDPQRTLQADGPLPPLQGRPGAEAGVTYVVLHGEAAPGDPVAPFVGPGGEPLGLVVRQGLRLQHVDSAAGCVGDVRAVSRLGERVGRITAYVRFSPGSAGGSLLDPVPFTAYDEFVFYDRQGATVGGFTAESSEGRVFNTTLPGRPAIRFGGVGRIRGGSGPFRDIGGLMTDNSLVVLSPHASASIYVLRVCDPRGRFRAPLGGS